MTTTQTQNVATPAPGAPNGVAAETASAPSPEPTGPTPGQVLAEGGRKRRTRAKTASAATTPDHDIAAMAESIKVLEGLRDEKVRTAEAAAAAERNLMKAAKEMLVVVRSNLVYLEGLVGRDVAPEAIERLAALELPVRPTRRRRAAKAAAKTATRLPRRSAAEIQKTLDRIAYVVKRAGAKGMRAEDIRKKLDLDRREMPRVLHAGLAAKVLRSKGEKRATVYYAR